MSSIVTSIAPTGGRGRHVYNGLAVGGPLDGQMIAAQHSTYQVRSRPPLPKGCVRVADTAEDTFTYRHIQIANCGFWTLNDIDTMLGELAESYIRGRR